MADDEDRDAILKRRQKFVAMALAGMSVVATSNCDNPFSPCLEAPNAPVPYSPPQACLSTSVDPQPCLDVAYEDPDAGEEQREEAVPTACLSIAPDPE